MIRFDSEAISDTTKSKMSFNCINTRSLIAENHSKEILLRFNLGTLHLLDDLIETKLRK